MTGPVMAILLSLSAAFGTGAFLIGMFDKTSSRGWRTFAAVSFGLFAFLDLVIAAGVFQAIWTM